MIHYIFLRNNYYLLSLVFILITGTSCTPDTLWDVPIETVKKRIYNSDYSFIEKINFTNNKASDIRVLGPGALYYFSIILSRTRNSDLAKEMAALSWQSEKKYWKDESGIRLLQQFLQEKEYKLLEVFALEYIKTIKESKTIVKKMYIEALYWQKKDKAVLDAIQKFFPGKKDNEKDDPEIILFKAVSGCRLNSKNWQDSFIYLFLSYESSSIHNRAYQFIIQEKERFKSFDEKMQQFFISKSLLSTGNNGPAIPLVEYFLTTMDPVIIKDSTIIRELGLTYLSTGKYTQGMKFLSRLSEKTSGSVKLDALEMAGRIARKNHDYRKAAQYLDTVVQNTRDSVQKDRAAWFYLSCVLEISPVRFTDEMILYTQQWDDPAYFDDIIQKSISILIAGKKWEILQYFFTSLLPVASNAIVIQVEFLTARLLMAGYIKEEGVSTGQDVKYYLQKVSKVRDINYYAFLASLLMKQEPLFLSFASPDTDTESQLNRKTLTPMEKFIVGFFDFGLIKDGYSRLIEYREYISTRVIFYITKRLQEAGYFKRSIWLMNIYIMRKDNQLSKQEMMYAYPVAFKAIIEQNAKKRGFFPPFFYALVREESAFDPENTSFAGAVGLSQLMPETANDIAGWLRLDDYNLKDPETNILMGTYYYSRLLNLLDNIPKTLISYNAGLGSLRKWEKEYTELPLDLFIEAIPYRETRGYVKKIIIAACIYSHLYEIPCSEVFTMLFPDILK